MIPGSRHNKIVQTIINLAHNLDMQVVAEGVENQIQLDQLQSLSCECGQGYLFSLPLSSEEVNQLLNNGQLYILKTS
jgi:EAL domain-containing protein (putative c-di-GMP-specific phosphodiesterase class I)